MKYWLLLITLFFTATAQAANPVVKLETSEGDIVIELYQDKSPITVANFLAYVDAGFYTGTVFHRIIPNFMIQGGGFSADYKKKATKAPIQNEADNGIKNARGTIAMARTGEPHSATAQFFINTVNNSNLDHRSKDMRGWGYTAFGKVTKGMDVVDKISATPTSGGSLDGYPARDVPVSPIIIKKATVVSR